VEKKIFKIFFLKKKKKKKSSHRVKQFILALSDFLRLKLLHNVVENFNNRKSMIWFCFANEIIAIISQS